MIMTLSEKRQYVDQDFLKSKLYLLGDMPDEITAADVFFQKAIKYAGEFMTRYENKSTQIEQYALDIVKDYMFSIEQEYKKLIDQGASK